MGSIKSKVFGDTTLDEDNGASSSHGKESVSSLQRSIANSSYSEDFLVVKELESKTITAGEMVNQRKKPEFDRSADELKKQSKIRPHSLYDDSTANFRTYDLNICESSDNEKKEPGMTSFQASNNMNKSQYFRSFRYASKRFFNKKNLNQNSNNNNNNDKTNNIEQPDTFDQNKSTPSFEKVFKSKSQTDLHRKINSKSSGTLSSSNLIDSDVRNKRNSVHSIASRVKNLRNSVTNFNVLTEQQIKLSNETSANNNNNKNITTSPKKIKDIKLKDRAKNIETYDKLPVPSLGLDKSSSSSKMEQENKDKASNEKQEIINEKIIEHLKDQIDTLNDQLLNIGKEDSKIINELIEKIEQISKMNSSTISSVGVQRNSQSSSSIFGKLFGKIKSSPQPSPNSSQTSFTSDYYSKLQAQNDALLQQQIAIDQLKQQLFTSASYTAHPSMTQSYAYYPNSTTSTTEHTHEHNHGHDHATEEDEEPAHTHSHSAYYNPNYSHYASNGYYNNASSPNTTSAYQGYQNQYYQMNGQFYYPNNQKGYQQQQQPQQQQQQQQLFYNPQTGKYFYQNNNAQTNSKNAYFYPQANAAAYASPQFFAYRQQNSNEEKAEAEEESAPGGIIITEVDDDENEYDLKKIRANKKKDYVDAISLKDE